MEKHKVVPDVISSVPKAVLKISFKGKDAKMGNELTPTDVKLTPTVQWDASPDSFYTLCMVDPDAPSRENPKFREWHHWLVVNIPGNKVSEGEVVSAYIGACPPKNTGLHRYVLLVYKQPAKINCDEPKLSNNSGAKRGKFSIKNFAQKYNLGEPIAGNFFQAQWDTYCTILQKQLK